MTKTGKMFLTLIIIAAVIGVGVYYSKKGTSPTDDGTVTPPVSTASIKGCFVAHLAKDVYTLRIENQTSSEVSGMLSYNNFEKDSSAGSFSGTFKDGILLGDYSFESEGMHSVRQVIFKKVDNGFVQGFGPVTVVGDKETFTDISQITYDPKSTFISSPDCVETFTDSDNTFNFKYSSFFSVLAGDKTPTTDWKLNTSRKGLVLAKVYAYRTYMPKTNFSDALLVVGRSADKDAIKTCLTEVAGTSIKQSDATVSGYPFKKYTFTDAGAGNIFETTSYRGIVDGDCYAIEYTIHSSNIANYDPNQGVTEFNKTKITDEFESIVKSFKFLISSN